MMIRAMAIDEGRDSVQSHHMFASIAHTSEHLFLYLCVFKATQLKTVGENIAEANATRRTVGA